MMTKDFKILDCTLRDGGYYTNWDFEKGLVDNYFEVMEALPIDYVEIGYRSMPLKQYFGEYFYCPEYLMSHAKKMMPSKKLAIILDEKNTKIEDLDQLLDPCKPYISMIRMAIAPQKLSNAIAIAKIIKKKGFEVGFNVMYMSNWLDNKEFMEQISEINGIADVFYMVDSYGGILPNEVKEITATVKTKLDIPVAFHGHNNMEMALINTLSAIDSGCSIVDATITGMGRGAGNLKTELLLTYLTSREGIKVSFNELSAVVQNFEELQKKYKWGTNLPYMVSGSNSLPQKDVMEWISLNRYSLGSIVNALKNKKDSILDNIKLPHFKTEKIYESVIIVGGGKSVIDHETALKKFIKMSGKICVIHAGVRYAKRFYDIEDIDQFYCLVGSEGYKLRREFEDLTKITNKCIFPPFPRKMGTILPEEIKEISYELENVNFISAHQDSPLSMAIQLALDIKAEKIILAGFDGYNMSKDKAQFQLANENQMIIDKLLSLGHTVSSATKTNYKNIVEESLFSYFG